MATFPRHSTMPLQQQLAVAEWTGVVETLDQIEARLAVFTDAQRSLAWSPEPPWESTGAHDCRMGGGCGLYQETRRAQWVRARHRFNKEQRRKTNGNAEIREAV